MTPKLQKAVDYIHPSQLHNKMIHASGKLDGIRAWSDKQTYLSTRGGKELKHFDKMDMELEVLCAQHNIPFVDGEMFNPAMTFQDISSTVLTGQPDPRKTTMKLHVFAIGGAFRNTQAMIDKIHEVFKDAEYIVPVDYTLIKKADINEHYMQALAAGYEGLMLRPLYGHYDQGQLFRLKPIKETDLTIVGYYEGSGANEGRLGGFIGEGTVDGKPIRVRVGGGYKAAERVAFWLDSVVYMGLQMEASYKYVTDKPNKDGFYSLREPVFNKMKLDR